MARQRDEQAGGERGVPADGGGAEQLEAAGLLVGPGVPDHHEDAHQRGQPTAPMMPIRHVVSAPRESP